MVFVPPTWVEGMYIWILYIIIPLLIGAFVFVYTNRIKHKYKYIGVAILIFCILCSVFGSCILWHICYEEPSVSEKIVTVSCWQPSFGISMEEVDSADDLLMQTSTGELYGNTEDFLFNKFNTRNILNTLKPNGTYKIEYYGWREGYNSGVPNILSVEEIIDESNCTNHSITDYMI